MRVKSILDKTVIATCIIMGGLTLTTFVSAMEMTPYQQKQQRLKQEQARMDEAMRSLEVRSGPTTKSIKDAAKRANDAIEVLTNRTLPLARVNVGQIQRCRQIMMDFEITMNYLAVVANGVNNDGTFTNEAVLALEEACDQFDNIVRDASKEVQLRLQSTQRNLREILNARNAQKAQLEEVMEDVKNAAFCEF